MIGIRDWMTGEPTATAFDTPIERPVGVVGLRAVVGAVGWPGC
jgi:hypothetical protein